MPHPGPSPIFTIAFLTLALTPLLHGCTPSYSNQRDDSASNLALLQLNVSPDTAEIFLNDDYHGIVNRWQDHTLSLTPGNYRLELRAPNHIPQRFDLQLPPDQLTRLTLTLEPLLHNPDEPAAPTQSPLELPPGQPRAPQLP
ncbi:hypothetical protein DL240_07275 [Lujinxingia litoralis]|uniref:PEGA domain-containing protein n=1 Tax=Lujinxingia litoralis TaxID=2211119 RepID=A0A328CD77_9DELT|nr:hypothetical protein [Lujinxingia litoralis]RAL23941.1 hypothetical protein DL240_07275 [Lujinxingia litoralis]